MQTIDAPVAVPAATKPVDTLVIDGKSFAAKLT